MRESSRLHQKGRICATAVAFVLAGIVGGASAESPVYPHRIEVTTPPDFLPPAPLQAYVEYAFRRAEVRDPTVPSRADQHGAAAGADFMWTPQVFSGLRVDYRRGDDRGVIADGTGVRSISDAYGASGYVAGFVWPQYFGGGVAGGFERTGGKTRIAEGRDRADRGWRYFLTPYLTFDHPIGPVKVGATPMLTLQWETLRFRRDDANNRSNTDLDLSVRLFAEWQVTQGLSFGGAATPTWVVITPSGMNLPLRDAFAVTFEGSARLWLSDAVALRVRYDYRAFDRAFRSQGVIATLSYSFVPHRPVVLPETARVD
jgi:hypothetical protein